MLLGKYYISYHALKQYVERCSQPVDRKKAKKCIRRDLRVLNIREIVRTDTHIYVFTRNSKEFIFVKANKDILCLKTFIKRNPEDTEFTIKKRKHLVCN